MLKYLYKAQLYNSDLHWVFAKLKKSYRKFTNFGIKRSSGESGIKGGQVWALVWNYSVNVIKLELLFQ